MGKHKTKQIEIFWKEKGCEMNCILSLLISQWCVLFMSYMGSTSTAVHHCIPKRIFQGLGVRARFNLLWQFLYFMYVDVIWLGVIPVEYTKNSFVLLLKSVICDVEEEVSFNPRGIAIHSILLWIPKNLLIIWIGAFYLIWNTLQKFSGYVGSLKLFWSSVWLVKNTFVVSRLMWNTWLKKWKPVSSVV